MENLELNDQMVQAFYKKVHKQYLEFAVEVLNQALERDREAMRAIMLQKFSCNKALAEHLTIQSSENESGHTIGVMEIINGIFGGGFISTLWLGDENFDLDKLIRFNLVEDKRLEL